MVFMTRQKVSAYIAFTVDTTAQSSTSRRSKKAGRSILQSPMLILSE